MNRLPPGNLLYYGDNLSILRRDIPDESVDLCYIDPPFNSKRNYNQIYNRLGREDLAQAQAFVDTWTWDDHANSGLAEVLENPAGRFTPQLVELIAGRHRVLGEDSLLAYLISIALRVTEIQRVLRPSGSFYVHCDPTASHYLKLVLDAVFCSRGGDFRNEIIWKRTSGHSDAQRFGNAHDVILYYAKSDECTWNDTYQSYEPHYVDQYYRYQDQDGRRFMSGDATAAGLAGGGYEYEWKGIRRVWRFPIETMRRLDGEGRIFYTRNGIARVKRYLDESKGMPAQDVWTDIEALRSWHAERMGYPTQKPEGLLERILAASSKPGDTVLDCYCGCGTTIAVAQRLNRRWIGMDITYQSIALILRRLEGAFGPDVLQTITANGIPQDMASAVALANKADDRVRKEFEKWAVLTYSRNRAMINEKKGADAGIDARAFFLTGRKSNAKVIFQVKSGGVRRGDIAALRGDMGREKAELAVLITLEEPSGPMLKEAKAAGQYHHETMGRNYDRISIVTIREILEAGARLDIPMSLEAVAAGRKSMDADQVELLAPGAYGPTAKPARRVAEPVRKPGKAGSEG